MKMHVLSGGRVQLKKKIYIPDAASGELFELPVMCFLLRHPQGNVLFDTGCHPTAAIEGSNRLGPLSRSIKVVSKPDDHLLTGLAALGIGSDDIDVVVNSHFHFDHCGCNEFFRRATIVCHANELAAARAVDAQAAGFLTADWDHPNTFETIDAQRDLFGDGRIVLLPLPGHTPGTTAALVSLQRSGTHLLASDTVALREVLERDYTPRNNWNNEFALKSMAEIRRIEAGGATIVFGHEAAQWETLRKGADFYD